MDDMWLPYTVPKASSLGSFPAVGWTAWKIKVLNPFTEHSVAPWKRATKSLRNQMYRVAEHMSYCGDLSPTTVSVYCWEKYMQANSSKYCKSTYCPMVLMSFHVNSSHPVLLYYKFFLSLSHTGMDCIPLQPFPWDFWLSVISTVFTLLILMDQSLYGAVLCMGPYLRH